MDVLFMMNTFSMDVLGTDGMNALSMNRAADYGLE